MDLKKHHCHFAEGQSFFAAPERDSDTHIVSTYHGILETTPHLQSFLDSVPLMVVLLNAKRQIVAANRQIIEAAGGNIQTILGKRPGELVDCIHAGEGPNGCGTSMACRVCGAVNAILQAQSENRYCSQECRISTGQGCAVDWKVTVNPIDIAGGVYQCLTIEDISDRKRREVLERTFFHDLINTIGGIIGFSRILAENEGASDELQEIIQMADSLLEEVQSQRDLILAENGDLALHREEIELQVFLSQMVNLYQNHSVARKRRLVLEPVGEQIIVTDVRLLRRVIGNMIKNALEASKEGEAVSIAAQQHDAQTIISVHNAAVMPQEVQLQIFNRSFSTKGDSGRGIGTYSIKLLGEQYLGGHVCFTSEEGRGTTFSIALPG